jgi:haloalkane dehalogenase
MSAATTVPERPAWLSDALYPFASHWLDTPHGRLHYVDEGSGAPIVFLHGNPSWSFEYREPIRQLRDAYRCIAVDHLGFGLSARPSSDAGYKVGAHAENFAALMRHLALDRVTLAFNDWGGPFALDFARREPERVAGLVVMNSWAWSVADDKHFRRFSAIMASPPLQFLICRFNLFVRQVMASGMADRSRLSPEIMAHYVGPQATPADRAASAALPAQIIGASDWLDAIWAERAKLADKPALLLWGLKDIAFRRQELEAWQRALPRSTTRELPDCGHMPAEESPEAVTMEIRRFLDDLPAR